MVDAKSNVELEKTVLGAALSEARALHVMIDTIPGAEVFSDMKNRVIYEAIIDLTHRGDAVDMMTVYDQVGRMGKSDVADAGYIADVMDTVATGANVEYHSRVLQQAYIRRELFREAVTASRKVDDLSIDVFDLVGDLQKKLGELTDVNSKTKVKTGYDAVKLFLDRQQKAQEQGGEVTGVPTGLELMDEALGGFQKSEFVVIAARPSMGKSALAKKHVLAAVDAGVPVALFSLEMDTYSLVGRIFSEVERLPLRDVRRGLLESGYEEKAKSLAHRLGGLLFIDDSSVMTLTHVLTRARRLVREDNVGLIVIDYLQLIKTNHSDSFQSVKEVSNSLKRLSRELDVPVVALAQLNRSVETTKKKIPELQHLKESGDIEQDADVVMLLWRPEYYGFMEVEMGDTKKETYDDSGGVDSRGKCRIMVAKNRNGALADFWVKYDGPQTRFDNLYYDRKTGKELKPKMAEIDFGNKQDDYGLPF